MNRPSVRRAALAAVCLGIGVDPLGAAILQLDARVTTSVQELLDGEPASSSDDDVALGEGVEPPLLATSLVESTDLDGELIAFGRVSSEFLDPTRLDQPNPEELAVEVGCFSNSLSISYEVAGGAEETRHVLFAGSDNSQAEQEIDFDSDGTRRVRSRVFISGAVILWANDFDPDDDGLADGSLNGTAVEVTLRVTRDEPGATLFETSLSVVGEGLAFNDPEIDGPLVVDEIGVEDLIALGIGEETADALREIEEQGALLALVIPEQEHEYEYRVTSDEPFALTAELVVTASAAPRGTGATATLGRPFSELAGLIEDALGGVDASGVERAANRAIARNPLGVVSRTVSDGGSGGRMCGAFGAESAVAVLSLGLMAAPFRPRRGVMARH